MVRKSPDLKDCSVPYYRPIAILVPIILMLDSVLKFSGRKLLFIPATV